MSAKESKVATQVRFNEETYNLLCLIAEEECRSINAQIEYFVKRGVEAYIQEHPAIDPLNRGIF